ncbi:MULTISPECIES: alpha/beta fold hydrolase [Corallococcus]|uniref:alpha/beta fold hydrolase n=1 Tax=Corallococcus TaxID=83461 RepID=UPI00117CF8DA|nr:MULTISPECIES: alpha/beta hydrolase [Corallococcus]NBD07584.1 alpha/beta fold hydrolase [Corallococcus silvisoli]TSC33589.1 alpha/beta hydrolase [Corallococcus sp. Z5C101001]
MLARTWRGVTKAEDADAYLAYLHQTGLAHYRRTPGNLAAYCLRKVAEGKAEFLLVTLWESMDAVKRFAGDAPERALFFPEDDRYLIDRDLHVTHYEVPFAEGQAFVGHRVRFDDFRVAGPSGDLRLVDTGGGGTSLPVVFVHGLAGNASHWQAQLEHLSSVGRRGIALELRGHGGSTPPEPQDYTVESLTGDIAAGVRALGLRRFVLVGHSIGAGVALAYAGDNPRQVVGLFLVDPMTDLHLYPQEQVTAYLASLDAPDVAQALRQDWAQMAGPRADVRERLLADLEATPVSAVVAVQRSSVGFDLTAALARYPGPKFSLIAPDNDSPRSLHRLGEGVAHQLVEGAGHWIHLDHPDAVNAALDAFLKKSAPA